MEEVFNYRDLYPFEAKPFFASIEEWGDDGKLLAILYLVEEDENTYWYQKKYFNFETQEQAINKLKKTFDGRISGFKQLRYNRVNLWYDPLFYDENKRIKKLLRNI